MIRVNIESKKTSTPNQKTLTPICRKCGGKYADVPNNALRQELVSNEFGQTGSCCPANEKGEFNCPCCE